MRRAQPNTSGRFVAPIVTERYSVSFVKDGKFCARFLRLLSFNTCSLNNFQKLFFAFVIVGSSLVFVKVLCSWLVRLDSVFAMRFLDGIFSSSFSCRRTRSSPSSCSLTASLTTVFDGLSAPLDSDVFCRLLANVFNLSFFRAFLYGC